MDKFKKGDIIDGKTVEEIIFEFKILSADWDTDSQAWVVIFSDESKSVVLTNHGKPYIPEWTEIDKIVEKYKKAILDIRTAISI